MLLFYDIEVFQHDALVMFKDIDNNIVAKFWSNQNRETHEDPSGFEGILDLIKGNTLVGYNNYHYDDPMLTCMMNTSESVRETLYATNYFIIKEGKKPHVSDKIKSLDTMQQISVAFPSLKLIEGNMGRSIVETSVSFDINRRLTDAERAEVEKYCAYDIESTIEVYKLREKSYFETKRQLVDMLPEDVQDKAMRWNTTTISANILTKGQKVKQWEDHKVPAEYWEKIPGIPDDVWEMWKTALDDENLTKKGFSKRIEAFGCEVVFGLGGLHGAPKKPCRYGRVLHADVGSMYPSIICKLNALDDATEIYDGIRKDRLKIKKTDKVKADALKLILNSVYGNFKNKYSTLYNPRASITVCIYGQIALFRLCEELYAAGYKIININTDGVVFAEDPQLGDTYQQICDKWNQEFDPLNLEIDPYDKWVQKDVNNYVAVRGNEIEVKGGEVNKYHKNSFFANNNCRIVQIAIVEKLVNNTDPINTLIDNLDKPLLWQYVLRAGGTFAGVCDQNHHMMQKVNRVFACNENVEYTKLYKTRTGEDLINFPDAPERMYLFNGDLEDLKDTFKDIVDFDHYKTIIDKKLRGWGVCT